MSRKHSRGRQLPALAVSPTLNEIAPLPRPATLVDRRVVVLCLLSAMLGLVAAAASQFLVGLINLCTNLAFFGRWSFDFASPADNHLGLGVLFVPVIGGLIIGIMARFGSKAIRGHGIPEAMEQVLTNESRIPARVAILKPVSAAISIGTGGPFGAEGPIIATGGALGSLLGQVLRTTPGERKTLLAAGAAAGMSATFGSPVAAVLLACELLLFEWRPRSLLPVAFASSIAAAARIWLEGAAAVFPLPGPVQPVGPALLVYMALGLIIGFASIGVTRAVYWVEDSFERLPIHWMWWPALGAFAVGIVGYFAPRTLGVGYDNITWLLSGQVTIGAAAILCSMKFLSWCIALGSGTSGGTLAPMFTVGGGIGLILGSIVQQVLPQAGIDVRVAALVGMSAIFAGASRALLASVVFSFETTHEPLVLLPLLGSCAAAYLVSSRLMPQTIMTEKIARRGVRPPHEYGADVLEQVLVRNVATGRATTLRADQTLGQIRQWLASGSHETRHQGFPVIDQAGHLVGVVTRKDLDQDVSGPTVTVGQIIKRPPVIVYDDCSVREAADHMLNHDVGRLPVLSRSSVAQPIGIITRSDVLSGYRQRLAEGVQAQRGLLDRPKRGRRSGWRARGKSRP